MSKPKISTESEDKAKDLSLQGEMMINNSYLLRGWSLLTAHGFTNRYSLP
jgi:hypothetical protein